MNEKSDHVYNQNRLNVWICDQGTWNPQQRPIETLGRNYPRRAVLIEQRPKQNRTIRKDDHQSFGRSPETLGAEVTSMNFRSRGM